MIPPLSNRLLACCGFVHPGDRVADVGCDHGYLGIYLLQKEIAASVIASDVNPMPLQSALHNAHKYGVSENITFFLSDGVRKIPRDFDCMVCAGMGADTMISILASAPWLKDSSYRLILQCQSRRQELRQWLQDNGYRILRETLAQDGKFIYPIMEVTYGPGVPMTPGQMYLSPPLLACGSPLLPAFHKRVTEGVRQTVLGLSKGGNDPQRLAYYQGILTELIQMEETIYGDRL